MKDILSVVFLLTVAVNAVHWRIHKPSEFLVTPSGVGRVLLACWIALIVSDMLFGLPDLAGVPSGSLATTTVLIVWQALSIRARAALKDGQSVAAEQRPSSIPIFGMAGIPLFVFGAVNLGFSLYQHIWYGPHWAGVLSFGLMGLICMVSAVAIARRGLKAG